MSCKSFEQNEHRNVYSFFFLKKIGHAATYSCETHSMVGCEKKNEREISFTSNPRSHNVVVSVRKCRCLVKLNFVLWRTCTTVKFLFRCFVSCIFSCMNDREVSTYYEIIYFCFLLNRLITVHWNAISRGEISLISSMTMIMMAAAAVAANEMVMAMAVAATITATPFGISFIFIHIA